MSKSGNNLGNLHVIHFLKKNFCLILFKFLNFDLVEGFHTILKSMLAHIPSWLF